MKLSKLATSLISVILIALVLAQILNLPAYAVGREITIHDYQFEPIRPTKALSLRDSIDTALRNYPTIRKKFFKLRAAKANVTLAKTQYLPNLNFDFQQSAVSPNRIASVVMNNVSGFDTVPVDSGPPVSSTTLRPNSNSLQGLNLNWLLVDFGMRKANDKFAYADARSARADVSLTKLDVAFAAAKSFLQAAAAKQIILSKQAELDHMEAAKLRVKTLVAEGLRPGVDTADLDFEVAKTKIALIRAEKNKRLALVDLAEKMGLASRDFEIISDPIIRSPLKMQPQIPVDLTAHPLARMKEAQVKRWRAKQKVLDKAYRPHLWLNASVWGRGSSDGVNPIRPIAGGVLPQVFNYMVGVTFSFPIMEYFPLKAQRRMARSNELAAKADLDLAMQILEKKDANARIMLEQSKKVADQTPVLVKAAKVREIKVLKRYSTGLTNVVALADAEKKLAEAKVENAIAQIDVWHSILALSYAQGDLRPFMELVDLAEGNNQQSQ